MAATRAEQEFTKFTYRQWAHMKERCQEQKSKKGRITRLAIPFTLTVAEYRAWVLGLIKYPAGSTRCTYCNRVLVVSTLSPDHMRALERGGSSGLDNIAPSCEECNTVKGEVTAEWFKFFLKCLFEMPDADSRSIRARLLKSEKLASQNRRNTVRIQQLTKGNPDVTD